jgi:exo-beta-1,3-glucanase (GH17 family)
VLEPWQFAGDYASPTDVGDCSPARPMQGFVLGARPTPCTPGKLGGRATATLRLPAAAGRQVVVLRLSCVGGISPSCADAVSAVAPGGRLTISVDQQPLWQAKCDAAGQCDSLALGDSPEVAFVAETPSVHTIELSASANVLWRVASLQVGWRPIPTLIQGIAYSPFRDCQNPNWGPFPTLDQVEADLMLVRHMGNALRTYSSEGIQGHIPALANQAGLRVSAGAWLGKDKAANEREIAAVINLAATTPLESVIVGNEVLLRRDLSEDELLGYLQRVKAAVKAPVTTAEIGSVLLDHPRVMGAVDYELVHLYPFWEGLPVENAALQVAQAYHHLQTASGKRVVIGETGWPSYGPANGSAVPSPENARRYLHEFLTVAEQEAIEYYYFDAFDELWKTEGGVGASWGMFDSNRVNKYDLSSVLIPQAEQPRPIAGMVPLATSTAGPMKVAEVTWPVYTNYAAETNHFAPSGWMGDLSAIHFDDCAPASAGWQKRIIAVTYSPTLTDTQGWAGIYWLQPENNWGTLEGGYDLTGFTELRFNARSDTDGARIKFFVGGVNTGPYPSSLRRPVYAREADARGFVKLNRDWREFHIRLQGFDLRNVIDGFGWAAERQLTPQGVTFYLDQVVFYRQPLPAAPTAAPAVPTASPAATVSPAPVNNLAVYAGAALSSGFDLGVDTSGHVYNWVTDTGGAICMAYPAGQSWGVVYVTVGPPGQRRSRDLSAYQTLAVDLRGTVGGELISVGIKDSTDPDNGREVKIPVRLSTEWTTYTFPLSKFATADLSQVYIPAEFVFEPGVGAEEVCFRNIWYLR